MRTVGCFTDGHGRAGDGDVSGPTGAPGPVGASVIALVACEHGASTIPDWLCHWSTLIARCWLRSVTAIPCRRGMRGVRAWRSAWRAGVSLGNEDAGPNQTVTPQPGKARSRAARHRTVRTRRAAWDSTGPGRGRCRCDTFTACAPSGKVTAFRPALAEVTLFRSVIDPVLHRVGELPWPDM